MNLYRSNSAYRRFSFTGYSIVHFPDNFTRYYFIHNCRYSYIFALKENWSLMLGYCTAVNYKILFRTLLLEKNKPIFCLFTLSKDRKWSITSEVLITWMIIRRNHIADFMKKLLIHFSSFLPYFWQYYM